MFKLSVETHKFLFIIPITASLLASQAADAKVYKWRDARGVVQYSDNPPVKNAELATPSEVLNSIQAKDLCSAPGVVKITNTKNDPKIIKAFLFS